MTILSDILAALDHWSEWKQLREAPAKIEVLEKRVANLERRLEGSAPEEKCPKCRKPSFQIEKSEPMAGAFGRLGVRQHYWKCRDCGYTDVKTETPK